MYLYGGTLIPESVDPAAIRAADVLFREADFAEFVRSVHRNVHHAIASGDARGVQRVLHPALHASLAMRRGEAAWSARVDQIDHVSILEAIHGARDRIVVRFGAMIGGRAIVEDWIFERPADVYPHLRGVVPTGCAGCGAPLSTDARGNCPYCGTHVFGVAGEWMLVDVQPPRIIEGTYQLAASRELGPEHPLGDLLAFVESIYLNVHAACAAGRLDAVRNVLTTEMRQSIDANAEGHPWGIPIVRLEGVELVSVQRGAREVVTMRIRAVADSGPFLEDWTFERPAAIPGRRASATVCTFCGAPVQLDERGNCRYCRTHLFGVAGDWRLARAVQPTVTVSHPMVVRLMQSRAGQIGCLLFFVVGFAITIGLLVLVFRAAP